ncbi:MAG: hypothetical protein ACI9KE_005834, partial [Polyangiales bacterium]
GSQATQALEATRSSVPQSVASQLVSRPEASSPASFVVPVGQATHMFEATRRSIGQSVASQLVFVPEASSPAAFVLPAPQGMQAFDSTRSSTLQRVASHMRSTVLEGVLVSDWPGLHTVHGAQASALSDTLKRLAPQALHIRSAELEGGEETN